MLKYLFISLLPLLVLKCVGIIPDYESLQLARQPGNITKVTLIISSSYGSKNISITDKKELDRINLALQNATEVDISVAGAFKLRADVYVFKNGKEADFMVHDSPFTGWTISFGHTTLISNYIFRLIDRYKN